MRSVTASCVSRKSRGEAVDQVDSAYRLCICLVISFTSIASGVTTYKPIPTAHTSPAETTPAPKDKHVQLSLLDHRKELLPVTLLRPLGRAFHVKLVRQQAFFCPGGTEECELIVVDLVHGTD